MDGAGESLLFSLTLCRWFRSAGATFLFLSWLACLMCTRVFPFIGHSVECHPLSSFFPLLSWKKKVYAQTIDVSLLSGLDCERQHDRANSRGDAVDDPLVYGASQDSTWARALLNVPFWSSTLFTPSDASARERSGQSQAALKGYRDAAAACLCCKSRQLVDDRACFVYHIVPQRNATDRKSDMVMRVVRGCHFCFLVLPLKSPALSFVTKACKSDIIFKASPLCRCWVFSTASAIFYCFF